MPSSAGLSEASGKDLLKTRNTTPSSTVLNLAQQPSLRCVPRMTQQHSSGSKLTIKVYRKYLKKILELEHLLLAKSVCFFEVVELLFKQILPAPPVGNSH